MATSEVAHFPYPKHIESQPIHIKELWTAVQALKRWGHQDAHIVLGTDSTVARSHIRSMLGCDYLTNSLVLELMSIPRRSLHTVFLYSEDNVADSPSRSKPLELHRFMESEKIMSGEWHYLKLLDASSALPRDTKVHAAHLCADIQEEFNYGHAEWSNFGTIIQVPEDVDTL